MRLYCDRHMGGSGGNVYAVFLVTPRGHRYIGTLEFGEYCVLPPDAQKRPRVATLWFMGIAEGVLEVHVLTEKGLRRIAEKTVVPSMVLKRHVGPLDAQEVLTALESSR